MAKMAERFAAGAKKEAAVEIVCKQIGEASTDHLLRCHAIAIGSLEYFGTMAGMVKDFFYCNYQIAHEKTIGLPYVDFDIF